MSRSRPAVGCIVVGVTEPQGETMRSTKLACAVGLVLALAAGCGDNRRPSLLVETKVARRTVAAGEPIDARCAVLDATGEPALDKRGEPLTDTVELVVSYRDPDSFAMDGDGRVIAARAGSATV